MNRFDMLKSIFNFSNSKMVLLVLDGLGGLPMQPGRKTALEAASVPHMDRLASESECGLHIPVAPGITPGSGPAHLALFGYDPVLYQAGRGVLAALGINFDLQPGDVAARGNFCTVDSNDVLTDRRAGRISTEKNRELCELLNQIEIPGIEVIVQTVKEHRFLIVFRGENLSDDIKDTDPQMTGEKPYEPVPQSEDADKTAQYMTSFIEKARVKLYEQNPANMVLLRGFSKKPAWPGMQENYGLRAAAIAGYPMYRGVARLIGMTALDCSDQLEDMLHLLNQKWNDFDYFYIHVKKTDSAGEDGDFEKKVQQIEAADFLIPRIRKLNPDVMAVTGDHSTPASLKSHSWHPVPVMLHSRYCRQDPVDVFGETACLNGALGPQFSSKDLMPLMLAHAGRLDKFGA